MPKEKDAVYKAAELITDKEVDCDLLEKATRNILIAIGEDPEREGLKRTPERVSRMYDELLSGYRTDPYKLVNQALFDVRLWMKWLSSAILSSIVCANTICFLSSAGRT